MDLKSIPTWGWVAGGGVVIIGAIMLTSKKAATDTTGQSSGLGDILQQLMTGLGNLQSDLQNSVGAGGSGSGAGGGSGGSGASSGSNGGGSSSGTGAGASSGSGSSSVATEPVPDVGTLFGMGTPSIMPSQTAAPLTVAKSAGAVIGNAITSPSFTAPLTPAGAVVGSSIMGIKPVTPTSYIGKTIPLTDTTTTKIAVKAPTTYTTIPPVTQTVTKVTSGQYTGKTVPI